MLQPLVNVLVSAAAYLLVAISFSLIYTTARFFHFAHGMVLTGAAYLALSLLVSAKLPPMLALCGAVLLGMALGGSMELLVYRRLRRQQSSATALLLASLGMYTALQAVVALVYGPTTRTLGLSEAARSIALPGSAWITVSQVAIILVSATVYVCVVLVLTRTRLGRQLRAVSSDAELAMAYGLNPDRLILTAFLVGSVLASATGILLACDTDLLPTMGFAPLLMGIVAMVIGGVGSLWGCFLGALLLALLQQATCWWLSSRWEQPLAFLLLTLFLLVRPQGLLGRPLRKTMV